MVVTASPHLLLRAARPLSAVVVASHEAFFPAERQVCAWQSGLTLREMERLHQFKLPEEPLLQELQGLQLMAIAAGLLFLRDAGLASGAIRIFDAFSSGLLAAFAVFRTPCVVSSLFALLT